MDFVRILKIVLCYLNIRMRTFRDFLEFQDSQNASLTAFTAPWFIQQGADPKVVNGVSSHPYMVQQKIMQIAKQLISSGESPANALNQALHQVTA